MSIAIRHKIISDLFPYDCSRFVIVRNRDKFLLRDDVKWALSYENIKVYSGNNIELRIVKEVIIPNYPEFRYVFVMEDEWRVMDDIIAVADITEFSALTLFKRYHWDTIKDLSLDALEWILNRTQRTTLSALDTSQLVKVYKDTFEKGQEQIQAIENDWEEVTSNADFNNPGQWMERLARLVLDSLKCNEWKKLTPKVDEFNARFQNFLKDSYPNIVSSSCPMDAPRIVIQMMKFLSRRKDEKVALLVVDGMNYWQALQLGDSLNENLGVFVKYHCMFSWLPTETQMARQAIFRGDYPDVKYVQSPDNERKLWNEFWERDGLPEYKKFYQHEGTLEFADSANIVAYVTVDLDSKMHASDNYNYLYANTSIWVQEKVILNNINKLIKKGYTVYITTDHGNIETESFSVLAQSDKVGAMTGTRFIMLSENADKRLFEKSYGENVMQIDSTTKTYYPVNRNSFSQKPMVTHGGTHWLEVLIPFMTISK